MRGWVMVLGLVACGGPTQGARNEPVVLCPAGSMLDPQKNACVAMDAAKPVDDGTSQGHLEQPRPHVASIGVDVTCSFSHGWVSLVPAGEYPKDDEFLMQALIGFTQEPSFWTSQEDYKAFEPYAAKACSATPVHLTAAAPGDYYLVAGQEGTFNARGRYDKNGVRRKLTVSSSTTVSLGPNDLTFTWDCISCPWVVFRGRGRDLEPFVVLASRSGRDRRGTDARVVRQVPVVSGRVTLRVVEIEPEETHLESLVLRANGHVLRSTTSERELRLGPNTQATLSYLVPGVSDGLVDVEVETTGYYDRR